MRPYTFVYPSVQYIKNFQGVNPVIVTGFYDYVICPTSNRGDMERPTAWSYTIHSEDRPTGTAVVRTKAGSGFVVTSKQTGCSGDVPFTANWENRDAAYNLALVKLNDQVRGDLDLSVALAEAGTTARMIKATGKLLNHARKLKPPGGFGSTKDVANGYLQFKYGWNPLVSDVFKAADESLRIVFNELRKFKAEVRIPRDGTYQVVYPSVFNAVNVPVSRNAGKGKTYAGCTIGLALAIPPSSFQLDRWTSMNPVSLAWELIPYSFVVDWFVDIGSTLRNVETACLYNAAFKWGYVSEINRLEADDSILSHRERINATQERELYSVTAKVKHIQFNRSLLSTYPFPRRPTVKVDLGSSQLFSAAALLRQLLPDGSKKQAPRRSSGGNPGPGLAKV